MAQIQEIKVMFDTNALFTGLGHRLINEKLQNYISTNKDRKDLLITFYIPSVVLGERKYQMKTKGLDLLPSVGKLEQLLGHQLGINEEILESRVEDAIKKEMKTYGLLEHSIDCKQINWPEAITLATQRRPPFEKGEKEKGFRDFVVAQNFLQLCKESPVTPKICRLVIVTNDGLLSEYLDSVCADKSNVKILDSIESLNSFIETMASTIGEDFLKEVQGKVSRLLWDHDIKDGLWNEWGLFNKITEQFKDILSEKPEGTSLIEQTGLSLSLPRFIKKDRHVIYWSTAVTIKKTAYSLETNPLAGLSNFLQLKTLAQPTFLSSNLDQIKKKTHEGEYIVDIHWHTTITTTKSIKSPKFDDLKYRETKWVPIES